MDNIQEFLQPIFFDSRIVGEALDNYDISDPHRRADEFDDKDTAPQVNVDFYDTSTSTPIKDSNIGLDIFPDYSDEVLSDYKISQLLGKPIEIPNVVDLDTSPDYSNFIKNTIRNIISSESEFNLEKQERITRNITEQ